MAIENLNWLWILIGLVGIIFVYKVAKQKGKVAGMGKTMPVLFLLLVVGVSAYYSGLYDYVRGEVPVAAVTPTVVTPPTTVTTLCAVEDTTVTLASINAYTGAETGSGHGYRVNGGPFSSLADAGSFTASPGDSLQILWGNASVGLWGSYYSVITNEVVPCAGTKTFTEKMYNNGTITLTVFNEENGAINFGENVNETLDAGDVVTLDAELKINFQRGVPHDLVMVAELNSSCLDNVIIDFGGVRTTTPDVYSTVGGANTTRSYTIPGPLYSPDKIYGSITLDVSNEDPVIEACKDMRISVFPMNYYIDDDQAGLWALGVEDENIVITGLDRYETRLLFD